MMRKTLLTAMCAGLLAACGGGAGTVPTSVCASGSQWMAGDSASPQMHPGVACIACHSTRDGPELVAAGTVFTAPNEKDDCGGASASGLSVVLTDANGATTTLPVNAMGNFFLERKVLALPYSAKVVDGKGGERQMAAKQRDGDCNGCHTVSGSQDAPGRILAP